MDINNSNKDNESKVENNKQYKDNLLKDAVAEFSKIEFKKDEAGFYNKIKNGTDSSIKANFKFFIANKEKYTGIDVDNANIFNETQFNSLLKINTTKIGVGLKTKRKALLEVFGLHYEINSSLETDLNKKVNELSISQLTLLLGSELEKDKFLNNIFGEKAPLKKDLVSKLSKFNISYDKLTREQKDTLYAITDINSDIYPSDIEDLFFTEPKIFKTVNDKQLFIKMFLPTVNLQQLLDWKIITESDAKKSIDSEYKKILKEFDIDELDFDDLGDRLEPKDIVISTMTFPEDVLNTILKKDNLSNFVKELNQIKADIKKDKEDEENGKIGSFDTLIKELGTLGKIDKIENFKEGNVLFLNTVELIEGNEDTEGNRSKEKSYTKVFLKVHKIDEKNKKIIFLNYGSNDLYNPNGVEEIKSSFSSFFEYLKKGNLKENKEVVTGTFLTKDSIQQKVNSGSIKQDKDALELNGFDAIAQKEDDYKKEYVIKKLLAEGKEKSDIKQEDIDKYNLHGDKEYEEGLKHITLSDYNSTLTAIDELDPEGKKYGFEKGVTIETKKGDFFTITDLDKVGGLIELTSLSGRIEQFSFQSFFDAFKSQDNEAKRTSSNIDNFEGIFTNATDNLDSWKEFKLKDGKIVKKSTNEENSKNTNIEYDYLINDKGNDFIKGANIVKIEKVDGDIVTVSLGNIKNSDNEKDKSKTIFEMFKGNYQIKLSMLNSWIHKSKLRPESLDSNKDFIEEKQEGLERKGSFLSRFFSRMSIADLLKGGEVWLESIKGYLNEGTEEHAAKFAEGVLGKFLSKELQYDLKSRLESSQKKRMEDYKQRLKDLDSKDSTELVKKWLMNKDSSEPQKEAAMIFMMENYGSLYTKKALFPLRGKFLWYEAMGGKVGDENFLKVKKDAEKSDIQFTEEDLIYSLVAGQCKGRLKPKRRGRLYKEIEALVGKGREEEFEKGKKDAGKKRTFDARVEFAIDELKGGSYPNAMGAFEEIVGKGDNGSMTGLNKLPFIMAFSGLAYDFDQKMVDGFKNNPANGMPVISTMFMMNPSQIDLYSQTVLELSKDLGKIHGGKYNNMANEAEAIFKKQQDSSNQIDKVEQTEKFFDKYGEALTRSMNMLTTGKTDSLSKTDQIILLKKDDEGKGVYKKYYDTFSSFVDGMSDFSKEDYITDAFAPDGGSGIIGMNSYKLAQDTFKQAQGGGFTLSKAGPKVWNSFISAIEEIKNTDYSLLGDDRKIKEEIIKDKLRGVLGGILLHHGSNQNALKGVMDQGTSSFFTKFNEWGVKSKDFFTKNIGSDRMMDLDDKGVNSLLDGYINNILDGKKEISDFSIPDAQEETRKRTEGAIE